MSLVVLLLSSILNGPYAPPFEDGRLGLALANYAGILGGMFLRLLVVSATAFALVKRVRLSINYGIFWKLFAYAFPIPLLGSIFLWAGVEQTNWGPLIISSNLVYPAIYIVYWRAIWVKFQLESKFLPAIIIIILALAFLPYILGGVPI